MCCQDATILSVGKIDHRLVITNVYNSCQKQSRLISGKSGHHQEEINILLR